MEELEERNAAAMEERERQVKLMEVKTSLDLQLAKLKMQQWLPVLPHSKEGMGSNAPSGWQLFSLEFACSLVFQRHAFLGARLIGEFE